MLFPASKNDQKGQQPYAKLITQSNCNGYASPGSFFSPNSNMAGMNGHHLYQSQFDSENETGSTYASNIAAGGKKALDSEGLSVPQKVGSF